MRADPSDVATIVVILGAPNDDQGRLSTVAAERCARAWTVISEHRDCLILPTGGWGRHFNTTAHPHGHYVREELLRRGASEAVFLPCIESSNTIEDAEMAGPVLERFPAAEVIVVTSDFHAPRARHLFERELPGRTIRFAVSRTRLEAEELARLQNHEITALARLRAADSGECRS
jgi:uncharacterized SAM-binding protein YcdF (DUF218 family)